MRTAQHLLDGDDDAPEPHPVRVEVDVSRIGERAPGSPAATLDKTSKAAERGGLGALGDRAQRARPVLLGRQHGRTERRPELLRLAPQLRDQRVDVQLAHRSRFYRSVVRASIARTARLRRISEDRS